MALFKIFKGVETDLINVPCHEGYAYFCEDTCNLWIDISNDAGGRLQVNAYAAKVLTNGTLEIDVDDILLSTSTINVAQGGTGATSLTENALIIGNGTDAVKQAVIEDGAVVIGNTTDGATGLRGVGAFFATTLGVPSFGTLPVSAGGTGGANQADARTGLGVYSKEEVDNAVSAATSVAYSAILSADGWTADGDAYSYVYSNTALSCGKSGTVPPIVTYTSNLDDYTKLDSLTTEATPGVGITFKATEQPTADIGLIIIDIK